MILAGGLSTRLYPLTKNVPKPLVPVAGVPNVVHVIRYLHAYGFEEIAINVHYLPDAIAAALGDGSSFGVRLHYSYEPELLGSAGAVRKLQPFFGSETFVVVGCDDLTDLPLDRMLAFHRTRQATASIGLARCEELMDAAQELSGCQLDRLDRGLRTRAQPFDPAADAGDADDRDVALEQRVRRLRRSVRDEAHVGGIERKLLQEGLQRLDDSRCNAARGAMRRRHLHLTDQCERGGIDRDRVGERPADVDPYANPHGPRFRFQADLPSRENQ